MENIGPFTCGRGISGFVRKNIKTIICKLSWINHKEFVMPFYEICWYVAEKTISVREITSLIDFDDPIPKKIKQNIINQIRSQI